jgi:hypothetical protein
MDSRTMRSQISSGLSQGRSKLISRFGITEVNRMRKASLFSGIGGIERRLG